MGSPSTPSPDDIALETFQSLLAQYPEVVQAVSDRKGAKPGQPSLAELDVFRYTTAPTRFRLDGDIPEAMHLDDVKTLVSWKLRHGKFRPTLMSLVASNDAATVDKVVAEAVRTYQEELTKLTKLSKLSKLSKLAKSGFPSSTAAALKILCRLRGIGPATASLLLAVHDPQRVVFFADEAYAWLCGGASHAMPSKYNDKEYQALCAATLDLQARLGGAVAAVDVEKVAYVLLKGTGPDKAGGKPDGKPDGGKEAKVADAKKASKTGKAATKTATQATPPDEPSTAKRKRATADSTAEPAPGVRRSQRTRRT